MKNFFLYPSISHLGLVAYMFAAQVAMRFSELHWGIMCFVIAEFFNSIVTYGDAQIVKRIQERLEAMK